MPLWSDGPQPPGSVGLPELAKPAARRSSGPREAFYAFVHRLREGSLQPLLVVGFVLIAAGIVWAVARGLGFYGVSVADLGYDLDQPPLLLAFVGLWLLYRGNRR
jgi:hypothetical protein